MPSEKSRYLKRNKGPLAPLDSDELRKHIHCFNQERLANLVSINVERDLVLKKALITSIAIQLAGGDWEKTKQAIDYALHFPDLVAYNDRHYYGLILDEIILALEILIEKNDRQFAMRVAQYVFECGQESMENFEDDWEWSLSLDDLAKWISRNEI